MTIRDFFKQTTSSAIIAGVDPRPRVLLGDGTAISIQASHRHYCDFVEGSSTEFETVEVGFPSVVVDELINYAEDPNDLTETVYGHVPMDTIEQVVLAHGGIVEIQ